MHRALGPGLFESTYKACLGDELQAKRLDLRVGLLINFNVRVLKDGIRRMVL